ncbi:alpha/beta hydrolase [Gammaproteobacteria bacterium]|nr:alpha/beta hydrolase [Gammaproteobacteria bacterium]|tara:strand:- start:1072 stop:2118 length:1047 start_codon:yes stop_codon:yes gene_type:complete
MENKIKNDPRIDKRIRAVFGEVDFNSVTTTNATTREEILAEQETEEAIQGKAVMEMINNSPHYKEVVTDEGLVTLTKEFTSSPDGNNIKIQYIRPDTDEKLPCVYYIHGGGMMVSSCFDELYAAWGRCMARQGVAVAMVDFRNAMWASSAPEIAPFPAGLNDCVSGLKWVHANAEELNIDNDQIIIAGESGGGNLTIATGLKLKQDGDIGLIKGLYALCPYIAGHWPLPENPSSEENEGILLSLHTEQEFSQGALIYGIDAYKNKDPLAWPSFATADDVKGLPKTYIIVNECDPLRDEGVNFYRLLREADVDAQCRQVMGSVHGTEIFLGCIEISDETAMSIANFCRR